MPDYNEWRAAQDAADNVRRNMSQEAPQPFNNKPVTYRYIPANGYQSNHHQTQTYPTYPTYPTYCPQPAPAQTSTYPYYYQNPYPRHLGPNPDGAWNWYGRDGQQMQRDIHHEARQRGAYDKMEWKPSNPRDDQQFWVVDYDGTKYLRSYFVIEKDLQPGEWKKHPDNDSAYFIRKKD